MARSQENARGREGRAEAERLARAARGEEGVKLKSETVTAYFAPEKSHLSVTRGELGSIFSQYHAQQLGSVWWRRLWYWLTHKGRPRPATVADYFLFLRQQDLLAKTVAAALADQRKQIEEEHERLRRDVKKIDATGKVVERTEVVGDVQKSDIIVASH